MKYVLSVLCVVSSGVLTQSHHVLLEDSTMTFAQLAQKYTQKSEEYDLVVEGGYILKLIRIPGDINKPVLIIHGAVDSADSFIVRGNSSLAVALSRENYDVWAINLRGNRYSRQHTTLNPDLDAKFWDFSVHEYGYYDLPATIDFILNKTDQLQLSAIGYSEGTTAMYVLGSTRPEYNAKIKILISLAPICYMHNMREYMSLLMEFGSIINRGFLAIGSEEIMGYDSPSKTLLDAFCMQRNKGYEVCLLNGLFLVTGADKNEIEPEFFPVIMGHFPAGTSRRNLNHLIQIRSKKQFVKYDYGPARNMLEYDTSTPPEYDLSKVTMKVALIVAKNDKISTIADVALLMKRLPNVVEYRVIKKDAFNHVDYIWGKTTYKTLFPYIFKLLNKYR